MAKRKARASKTDRITTSVVQTFAHDSTADLNNKRDVLAFEAVVADQEIAALQAKLAEAKTRRARLDAVLAGIETIVGKR